MLFDIMHLSASNGGRWNHSEDGNNDVRDIGRAKAAVATAKGKGGIMAKNKIRGEMGTEARVRYDIIVHSTRWLLLVGLQLEGLAGTLRRFRGNSLRGH